MKIKVGNLFDSTDRIILVTGNSYVNKDHLLVMGRGAALELNKYTNGLIPLFFGERIEKSCGHLGRYGLFTTDVMPNHIWGVFQVKYHFKSKADLDLIEYSCTKLMEEFSDKKISMNFPGIGYGGLKANEVFPVIAILGDNVTTYIKSLEDLK